MLLGLQYPMQVATLSSALCAVPRHAWFAPKAGGSGSNLALDAQST